MENAESIARFSRKKEAEKEFNVFIQKLNQTFLLTDASIFTDEGSNFLPKNVIEIRSLIYDQPILYWKEHIEQQNLRQLLVAIENLIVLDIEFKRISSLLDTDIKNLLIKHTSLHFLEAYTSAFYALINGIDNDELKRWVSHLGLTDEKIDTLREQQNEFPQSVADYKDARELLVSSAEDLKTLIINSNTPT
nr:hypothetical protein [Priestia megaterium]MDH3173338.1 hypothetical protein [Priestia megaterium]